MYSFLSGAIFALAWISALIFYRFYRKSNESIFSFFGWAFFLMGVERLLLAVWIPDFTTGETRAGIYMIRLLSFLLILSGIAKKNIGS